MRFLYLPEFDNDRERVLEHILQELAAEAGIMECDHKMDWNTPNYNQEKLKKQIKN